MPAPGYMPPLFPDHRETEGPGRWRVVADEGTRGKPKDSLVLVVGQARRLAHDRGRAWIVADEADAVEIAYGDGRYTVTPCGPGWPAVCLELLTTYGTEK